MGKVMEPGVKSGDWLWLLGSLASLHGIPFDAELLQREFPPPYDENSIRRAASELGLVVGEAHTEAEPLDVLPTPFVAWRSVVCKDTHSPEASRFRPLVVLKVDGDRVLFFEPGSETHQTSSMQEFVAFCLPKILLVKRAKAAAGDGDLSPAPKPFGFSWFFPEFLRHKRIWRDVLVVSLMLQLLGLGTPLLTQVVIDKVVVHHTLSTLAVVGVGLAIALLFSAAFGWLRQYLILHTGNRIDAVLGSSVFGHLLRLPLPYFQYRPTGVLVARLHGVETIREFLSGASVSLVLDIPFMVVLLAVMFLYSWQLTLISLGALVLLIGLSLIVTPVFRSRLNQQFLLGARNQSFVTEYTAGMETVKSLQMEPKLEARYGELLADYLAAGFKTRQLANTYNISANAIDQLQTLSILVVGALLVMNSDGFTVGMLVAFQMFSGRLSQPVLKLVGLYQEFQQTRIAIARLGDIVNMPKEPYSAIPARARNPSVNGARIDLQDIGFRYDEKQPWLYRHMSLGLPAGKALAIMGPSGSGKSTLAKLLQGFYLPQEGRILIDGTDLQHLSANELRGNFGVVPQETILFSGTLYDNLLAANPHADFEDVVTACRMAEIHDFIETLPAGYQTEVGERGAGLSGGQRQRIAIARALLKRPRVLIFDEATSALDPVNAEQLAKTINSLKGVVTLLFIAHQLPKGLNIDAVVKIAPRPTVVSQEPSVPSGHVTQEAD